MLVLFLNEKAQDVKIGISFLVMAGLVEGNSGLG